MSATTVRFRDSPKLLAAEYVRAVPMLIFALTAVLIWVDRSTGVVRTMVLLVSVLSALGVLVAPIVRHLTVSYAVDDRGVTVDSGLFDRRSVTLAWDSVAAVEARSSWDLQMFGISSLVISQAADDARRVRVRGVDRAVRAMIEEQAAGRGKPGGVGHVPTEAHGAAPADPPPVAQPDPLPARSDEAPESETIYSLSWRSLVVVSLVHGQLLVLAPPALLTLWELVDMAGLGGRFGLVAEAVGPAGLAAGGVVAVILVGAVATIVRYNAFTVSRRSDSALLVEFGLVERVQRVVRPEALVGVVVQRNIVEVLLRRARLVLLTHDAQGHLTTDVVFPAVPERVLEQIVRDSFGRFGAAAQRTMTVAATTGGTVARILRNSLIWTGATVAVYAGVAMADGGSGLFAAVAALVTAGVVGGVGRVMSSRLAWDSRWEVLLHERRFLVWRCAAVDPTSVHGLATWQPSGSSPERVLMVNARYFAGRARGLLALRTPARDVELLRRSMTVSQVDGGRSEIRGKLS